MAVEMARVHLCAGHDDVVPQFLGRLDFVVALQRLREEVGAEFVEMVLLSSPDEAGAGGPDALRDIHRRLFAVVAARPATRTVVTWTGRRLST